jgi:hypothetical protein
MSFILLISIDKEVVMIRELSPKTHLILVVSLAVLIALLGCGPSKEKQKMLSFITEYKQAVTAYEELVSKNDTNGVSEMKTKIESFSTKWTDIKVEIGSEVTPQTLDELDNEFATITKKYQSLSNSS